MTLSEKVKLTLIIALWIGIGLIWNNTKAAQYSVSYMPVSWHNSSKNLNETHHGLGINASFENGMTYSGMTIKNSHKDRAFLLYASKNLICQTDICLDIGGVLGLGYRDQNPPVGLFISARWKFISIVHAPKQITTLIFTIPLGN